MYRLDLGVDPSDQHQLFTVVTKDIVAAHRGNTAARRRVAAYYRAQRTLQRQVDAEARDAPDDADDRVNETSV
jgi:hypothetical protein